MTKTTKGIRRVLVVAVVAILAFGGAIVALADDARRGCVIDAARDPALEAKLLGAISLDNTSHEMSITRAGDPVVGAKVCARLYMRGMEAMGSSDDKAVEIAPGIYKISVVFVMSGAWSGGILIEEPGKAPVSAEVRFDVV